jgi:hypothetical protein
MVSHPALWNWEMYVFLLLKPKAVLTTRRFLVSEIKLLHGLLGLLQLLFTVLIITVSEHRDQTPVPPGLGISHVVLLGPFGILHQLISDKRAPILEMRFSV